MKIKYLNQIVLLLATVFFSLFVHADTVWIDVRSVLENKMDAIEGDLNIPHENIVEEVAKLYPDKTTEISLYCRSGGRAGKAFDSLQAAGYKNIKNTGSIEDARKLRGINSGTE